MKKHSFLCGSFILLSAALAAACGNETSDLRDALLAVSNDATDVDGSPITQVWLTAQNGGTCLVLDSGINVLVNGKAATVVSRGSSPDWITKRYNRYAGCESALFKLPGSPSIEGARMDVTVTGADLAASTRLVFQSNWKVAECKGVKSCCSSQASSSPVNCIDAK